MPRVALVLGCPTTGVAAAPPLASKTPPNVPEFVMEARLPKGKAVASTFTSKSPATCTCAEADETRPKAAKAAVKAGKIENDRDGEAVFGVIWWFYVRSIFRATNLWRNTPGK